MVPSSACTMEESNRKRAHDATTGVGLTAADNSDDGRSSRKKPRLNGEDKNRLYNNAATNREILNPAFSSSSSFVVESKAAKFATATATTQRIGSSTIAVTKTTSTTTGILDLTDDLLVLLFQFVGGGINDCGYYNKNLITTSTKFYRIYKSRLFEDDLKVRIMKQQRIILNTNEVVKLKNSTLRSKNETIAEKNEILGLKDERIQSQERSLGHREQTIASLRSVNQSNDIIISSLENRLQSQESIINIKERRLQSRNETIQSQKETISSLKNQLRIQQQQQQQQQNLNNCKRLISPPTKIT